MAEDEETAGTLVGIVVDHHRVSEENPMPTRLPAGEIVPTESAPVVGTWNDATNLDIDAGGSSQVLFAANPDRGGAFLRNISAITLWVNIGAAAAADTPSIPVLSNEVWTMDREAIDDRVINVFGSTTGAKFVAKEFS